MAVDYLEIARQALAELDALNPKPASVTEPQPVQEPTPEPLTVPEQHPAPDSLDAIAKQLRQVSRWMAVGCAAPKNPAKVWGSGKSLYRDYTEWCQQANQTAISTRTVRCRLGYVIQRDPDGWQGLCLLADWAASKELGSKSFYPLPLDTEKIQ